MYTEIRRTCNHVFRNSSLFIEGLLGNTEELEEAEKRKGVSQ